MAKSLFKNCLEKAVRMMLSDSLVKTVGIEQKG